ncbi:glycosyltransferase [Paenibacillus albiflavus]|uniref:Glycosyltransferase n=1 Tax=Paenibacillus albiflavus TaxID=2545760 RepID=A0A4R4EC47_9BACL|nr:glycosyltransferase [Paenibacillus albiflavus]TCZ77516.1 glycosyltransferase [Paenibacillus albiflavus]
MLSFIVFKDILMYQTDSYLPILAEGLEHFVPLYVGSRKIMNPLPLDEQRVKVLNKGTALGWIREGIFKYFGGAPFFWNSLRKSNPKFIHAHYGFGGVLALPIQKKLKIPMIVTFHGHDATATDESGKQYFTHRLYVKKRSELQERAALFIAVSNFIKQKMIAQGYPEHKIITHYLGIDVDLFQPDPSIIREPIVLFVGRFVENKGGEYLIRAMECVQQTYPEAKLVLIGDGELREELEEMARHKIHNYQFLGMQTQDVIRKWLNKAKVLCVPSITIASGKSEAFGLVFIEANAMGVPVVSFDTGGIAEAVEHDKTGYLLPEKDWLGLAKYITLLLKDENLWQQLSTQGIQRVSQHFNMTIQKHKLEDIYNQLMQSGDYSLNWKKGDAFSFAYHSNKDTSI